MRAATAAAVVGLDDKGGLEVGLDCSPETSRLKAGVLEGCRGAGCDRRGQERGRVQNVEEVHPVEVRADWRGHHNCGAKLFNKVHHVGYPESKAIGGGHYNSRREETQVRQEVKDGKGVGADERAMATGGRLPKEALPGLGGLRWAHRPGPTVGLMWGPPRARARPDRSQNSERLGAA